LDRNPESSWNPRVPADITPSDFERLVRDWLARCGQGDSQQMTTEHLGRVEGSGGEYEIDVLAKLSVFDGAELVILVECKHQARPVERKEALALDAKLRDVSAHKGMLFSTSGFQKGALEYAAAHGIATVTVIRGEWTYETRVAGPGPVKPPPWVKHDIYAGLRLVATEDGISSSLVEMNRVDSLVEWLESGAE